MIAPHVGAEEDYRVDDALVFLGEFLRKFQHPHRDIYRGAELLQLLGQGSTFSDQALALAPEEGIIPVELPCQVEQGFLPQKMLTYDSGLGLAHDMTYFCHIK